MVKPCLLCKPLSLPGNLGVENSSPIIRCYALRGICSYVHSCFSYAYSCGYFLIHMVCRSFSAHVCLSPKGNLSLCSCVLCVSMGGEIVKSILFCHAATITAIRIYNGKFSVNINKGQDKIEANIDNHRIKFMNTIIIHKG